MTTFQRALFLIVILCSQKILADRNTPIKVMAFTNGTLMSTPTLPLLYGKKGEAVLKVQPAHFTGELGNQGQGSTFIRDAEFSGFAASAIWSHLLTESIGWYVTGLANSTSGDFSFNVNDPSDGNFQLDITDAKSTQFMASLGLSYTLFANSFMPLQFFGGPAFVKTDVEQTVRTTGAASQDDDFDMTLSPTTISVLAGAQMGIRLSDYLVINPYFVISMLVNEDDKCQGFETVVRQTGPLFDFGDPNCQDGQNSSTSQIEYDTAFASFGVYLIIPKWGFAVNVFAQSEEPEGIGEPSLQLYAVNFSFVF